MCPPLTNFWSALIRDATMTHHRGRACAAPCLVHQRLSRKFAITHEPTDPRSGFDDNRVGKSRILDRDSPKFRETRGLGAARQAGWRLYRRHTPRGYTGWATERPGSRTHG